MRGRASRRRDVRNNLAEHTGGQNFLEQQELADRPRWASLRRRRRISLGRAPFGDPLSITPRRSRRRAFSLLRAPIPLIGLIKSPPSRSGRALPTGVTTQGTRRVKTEFAPLQQTNTAASRRGAFASRESRSNLPMDPGSVNSLPVKSRCRILLVSEASSFLKTAALPAAHLLPA